jgi:hypothetical protein
VVRGSRFPDVAARTAYLDDALMSSGIAHLGCPLKSCKVCRVAFALCSWLLLQPHMVEFVRDGRWLEAVDCSAGKNLRGTRSFGVQQMLLDRPPGLEGGAAERSAAVPRRPPTVTGVPGTRTIPRSIPKLCVTPYSIQHEGPVGSRHLSCICFEQLVTLAACPVILVCCSCPVFG